MLDFFLHIGSQQDRKHAVVAFLDLEQVPICYDGKALTPLYVLSRASTWHAIPVQISVPTGLGQYELRILAIGEPFARLDVLSHAEQDSLSPYPPSSARILLRVE
jgi:hypothetical protein